MSESDGAKHGAPSTAKYVVLRPGYIGAPVQSPTEPPWRAVAFVVASCCIDLSGIELSEAPTEGICRR
jgi:hypothetical protein